MTQEEFGLELFETVKCIGRLLAIQDQINAAVHRGKEIETLVTQREQLRQVLTPLMLKLEPGDVTEITRRYPMVAML